MIMMATDSIRHKIVFKVRPSDMKMKAIIAKMMVPVEKPIILIGHNFSPKSWKAYLEASIAK